MCSARLLFTRRDVFRVAREAGMEPSRARRDQRRRHGSRRTARTCICAAILGGALTIVGGAPAGAQGMAKKPSAPLSVTATGVFAAVNVAWTAPGSDGGSPVTGYTVTAEPGDKTCSTTADTCAITGLTPGQRYSAKVQAANVNGLGKPSKIVRAIPVESSATSTADAYDFLDTMMDMYATGTTLRLVQSYTGGVLERLGYTDSVTYDDALMIDALLTRGNERRRRPGPGHRQRAPLRPGQRSRKRRAHQGGLRTGPAHEPERHHRHRSDQ